MVLIHDFRGGIWFVLLASCWFISATYWITDTLSDYCPLIVSIQHINEVTPAITETPQYAPHTSQDLVSTPSANVTEELEPEPAQAPAAKKRKVILYHLVYIKLLLCIRNSHDYNTCRIITIKSDLLDRSSCHHWILMICKPNKW